MNKIKVRACIFPIPILGEQVSEDIIRSQLDSFFRCDKSQVYSSPCENIGEAIKSLALWKIIIFFLVHEIHPDPPTHYLKRLVKMTKSREFYYPS